MPICPVCKAKKASYYRCYTKTLGRLMAAYPSIVEGVDEWKLFPGQGPSDRSGFSHELGYGLPCWRIVDGTSPEIRLSKKGVEVKWCGEIRYEWYDPFSDYLWIREKEDLILVPICLSCAKAAREQLGLEKYAFSELFAVECPCCGYYTLSEAGKYDICPVCFWEDDGTRSLDEVSGPNHITLRLAMENYERYGACDERVLEYVRPPTIDEYPRHH